MKYNTSKWVRGSCLLYAYFSGDTINVHYATPFTVDSGFRVRLPSVHRGLTTKSQTKRNDTFYSYLTLEFCFACFNYNTFHQHIPAAEIDKIAMECHTCIMHVGTYMQSNWNSMDDGKRKRKTIKINLIYLNYPRAIRFSHAALRQHSLLLSCWLLCIFTASRYVHRFVCFPFQLCRKPIFIHNAHNTRISLMMCFSMDVDVDAECSAMNRENS